MIKCFVLMLLLLYGWHIMCNYFHASCFPAVRLSSRYLLSTHCVPTTGPDTGYWTVSQVDKTHLLLDYVFGVGHLRISKFTYNIKGQVVVSVMKTNSVDQVDGHWPDCVLARACGHVILWLMAVLELMLLSCLFVLLSFPILLFKAALLPGFLQSFPSFFHFFVL